MSFEFYEEANFRQTDLGPLPQDWQVVRLGNIEEILTGGDALHQEEDEVSGKDDVF